MAILLQPDSLSFASNLKKFVISSAEEIRFKLSLGETLLIDELYTPDAAGKIAIDVKEVVNSQLSLSLPSTHIFEQQNICKSFTAQVDETTILFSVIRAGVENLAVPATEFLTQNFLTWQPQSKLVGYSQPEWLTYYAPVAGNLKIKFYLSNDTTVVQTLTALAAGSCTSVNMMFSRIMALQAGSKQGYYDVWFENGAAERLTYIQRYIYKEIESVDEYFLFENSLGGIDTTVMSGESVFAPELSHSEGVYEEESEQLDDTALRLFKKSTGWKSKVETAWLWDFFRAIRKYKVDSGVIRKITLKESEVVDSSYEDMKSFSFTYRIAADKGLLNIPRSSGPLPENLEITTPEGLFFLAPRLSEFPSAEFVDEFLFPIQSPYIQEWKKISVAVVKSSILDYVRSQISVGIPQSLLDLSDIDSSLATAAVGSQLVKLASGKWGPGSVSIDLSNYYNKSDSDARYAFKSHSHDYVPVSTYNLHVGDSVKHTTQEDKEKISVAYNERHTHSNKSNLDSINQNLSQSSNVTFNNITADGSISFYGEVGSVPFPVASLLDLSDIDSSLATAAMGSPLVKLASGKWGPGSVSIDLSNYFSKEESDARFAFKSHSHDYVAPTAFNSHTADMVKHITAAERAAWNAKESALNNPDVDGKILASTASGVRSWVNRYVLPVAAAAMLGGVMIGSNIDMDAQGRISVAAPYSHPASHPASMITEDSTRRFLTDTERYNWNDAYDKRHTHGNKSNLDSINQNLSQTSNVKFNDVIADGSLAFYGGVGSGSTPVASLLDLSDIDASISAAATGTPLVKLANGKWGAGSVSIDLSNYYNKSDADARYAFKSHSHDYVPVSTFSSHTHAYLPLSGGTLNGTLSNSLIISTTAPDNYIVFAIGGYSKSYVGWTTTLGTFMQSNQGGAATIGILDSGIPYYSPYLGSAKYTLLHSGNYNSYSPTLGGGGATGTWGINISGNAASASSANRLKSSDASGTIDLNTYLAGGGTWWYYGQPNTTILNAPTWFGVGSVYQFNSQYESLSLQIATTTLHNTTTPSYRIGWRMSNNLGFQYDWQELYHSGNLNRSDVSFTASSIIIGSNYVKSNSVNGYLELQSTGDEMLMGGNAATMYINYRANSLVSPTKWIWNAGAPGTYPEHELGGIIAHNRIYSTSYLEATYAALNSISPLFFHGIGSGIYTRGVLYVSAYNGFSLEAPWTAESGGARVPIEFTWRGGFASTGGLKLDVNNGMAILQGMQFKVNSARPLTIGQGYVNMQGDSGGWAMRYGFLDSAGNDRGGFGILGSGAGYDYLYVGNYGSEIVKFYPNKSSLFLGSVTAPAFKIDNWEIKQNATGELEFILSGVLKFKITSTGIVSSGGVAFYS